MVARDLLAGGGLVAAASRSTRLAKRLFADIVAAQ
jgi:hypothetical protein